MTGETCLLLPLRGASLAAWLNWVCAISMPLFGHGPDRKTASHFSGPCLSENGLHLVPQRDVRIVVLRGGCIPAAVMLGGRRLRGADGIGGGETVDQPRFQPGVHFGIGPCRLFGVGGVRIVGCGVELLGHGSPSMTNNAPDSL